MTTTIKVSTELRDRLREEADRDGSTLGVLLDDLLRERERARRFAALSEAMAATSTAGMSSWSDETDEWDATVSDGLST